MSTHELIVDTASVTKRFTSWNRLEHLNEWAMLVHLDHHAPGLAPRPIAADLAALPPTIAMSLLPGEPLVGTMRPEQLRALTAALSRLWSVPVEPHATVRGWTDDLAFGRRLIDGPVPTDETSEHAYRAAQAWWRGPDPLLLSARPVDLVLGHRDPNLPNYLWDGRRVRIVDFEDAAPSDPATELAILIEHLSARDLPAEGLLDSFEVDPIRFRAARRLWAMFWFSMLLPGGPAAHRNPLHAARDQARRLLDLLDG